MTSPTTTIRSRLEQWKEIEEIKGWSFDGERLESLTLFLLQNSAAHRQALEKCVEALERGPKLLEELAEVYLKSGKPHDHDCALELASALRHWVVNDTLKEVAELLG